MSLEQVSSLMRDIDDYERGALGNVLDLEAPYRDYLRIGLAERGVWRDAMDKQTAPENFVVENGRHQRA